jgi:hypothetical protein
MRKEGAARLFLKRAEARIVLVTALAVGTIRVLTHDWRTRSARRPNRQYAVWSADRDVEHRHDGAPEIDRRFLGRLTGNRVNESDIRGQWQRYAHQPVFYEIRKVARIVTIHTEVIGIDRSKERIIRVLVVRPFIL